MIPFAQNTRDEVRVIGGGVAGALSAQPGMKQQTYIAIQDAAMPRDKKQNGIGIAVDAPMYTHDSHGAHAVAHAVTTHQAKGGDPTTDNYVVTHALTAEGADASEDGTGRETPLVAIRTAQTSANGHGIADDVAHTLDGANGQAVMGFYHTNRQPEFGNYVDVSPTVKVGSGTGANPPAVAVALRGREGGATAELSDVPSALRASQGVGDKAHVMAQMHVRRLTPLECLRLMGLPDDWLDLDPPLSDSAKYRLVGNSVAVPVVEWIMRRIAEYDATPSG